MALIVDRRMPCPHCGGPASGQYRPVVEGDRVARYDPQTALCWQTGCTIAPDEMPELYTRRA